MLVTAPMLDAGRPFSRYSLNTKVRCHKGVRSLGLAIDRRARRETSAR